MEVTRFLAFSCPHCPLQDDEAIDWLIEQIAKRKPDLIVHLGDGHEADSASRWPSEYDWELEDEFRAHNELLVRIRKASPKSKRVMLDGNHDDNLKQINRIDKRLRGLCDPAKHEPEWQEWKHVPYIYCRNRGVYRLGQVTFAHGYECGVNSDEAQAVNLGVPNGLFISGHTHRPVQITQAHKTKAIPLPYWYANAGCMRDLKPPYMTRKRTHQWGQAIVVGKAANIKSPRSSCFWTAETIVFRMYNEWSGDGQ